MENSIETIDQIADELIDRAYDIEKSDSGDIETAKFLRKLADRIRASHNHVVNRMVRIDNACVAQCATLLDDHIKAVIAEAKKGAK